MTTVCPGLLYAGDEVKVQLEGRQAVNTQENSQMPRNRKARARATGWPHSESHKRQ